MVMHSPAGSFHRTLQFMVLSVKKYSNTNKVVPGEEENTLYVCNMSQDTNNVFS